MAEAIHAYGSLCNGFLIGFPQDCYDVSCFDLEKNREIRCMLSPAFCEHPKELTTEMVISTLIAMCVRSKLWRSAALTE